MDSEANKAEVSPISQECDLFGTADSAEDKKYTFKISAPQYLPNQECPKLRDLTGLSKYKELLKGIDSSSVSDEEKDFLRLAAARHVVFSYSKVADYYAHASPEMQRLMEDSALVIIDFNDAIADSYVRFDRNIKKIMEDSGRKPSEEYHNQVKK